MSGFTITLAHRLLEQLELDHNSTADDLTTAPDEPPVENSGGGGPDRGAYEFVAFVLWYLFLVLCCIVPTCCAYRRRRMLEARYGQQHHPHTFTLEQLQQLQQAQQQMSAQNGGGLLFLPAHQAHLFRNTQDLVDSEAAKEERTRRLEESLKETTFVVKAVDILEGDGDAAVVKGDNDENNKNHSSNQVEEGNESQTPATPTVATTSLHDMEALALADLEITSVLRLPQHNGQDTDVPAVCAICLCGYEVGDSVTYSRQPECKHAFHQECIVPWLAKTNDGSPKCPCCRQVYCHIQPITFRDLANLDNNNDDDNAEQTTARRTTLTPLEFMMAVRSGGSSLFFPHEFQVQRVDEIRNATTSDDNIDNNDDVDDDEQNSNDEDIEQGNGPGSMETTPENEGEERRDGNFTVNST